MPITYTIDEELGFVRVTWVGDVTAAQFREHLKTMLGDPAAFRLKKSIADLRNARLLFTGDIMASLASLVIAPALAGGTWNCAIVVGLPDQYGQARQQQVYNESLVSTGIFEDYDSAIGWLLRD